MIVIPDIHGRSFWKNVVKDKEKIIFLGDYFDPYLYEEEFSDYGDPEYESNALAKQDALCDRLLNNFNDIIELKKQNPKDVVLLLGNHDCHYFLGTEKGSRYEYLNAAKICRAFQKSSDLFEMAHEEIIDGKRFVFSHAGLSKNWIQRHSLVLQGWNDDNIVDWVNNAYLTRNGQFINCLNDYSSYRGGFEDYGSMVWADMREYLKEGTELFGDFQILGHTQLRTEPFIWDNFADLDCRRSFLINNKGEICEMDGTKLEKSKNFNDN